MLVLITVIVYFAVLLAATLAGCVSFDAADARRAQTESYTNSLSRLEAKLLSRQLTLDDCLEIAMTNNYEVLNGSGHVEVKDGMLMRMKGFKGLIEAMPAIAPAVQATYWGSVVPNSRARS